MNLRTFTAFTAIAFLAVGTYAAFIARLPRVTALVAFTGFIFLCLFYWRGKLRPEDSPPRLLRGLILAGTMIVTISIVVVTGGVYSPFTPLLCLPIMLGTLAFGLMGSLTTAVTVAGFFIAYGEWGQSAAVQVGNERAAAILCLVFLLVGLTVGTFADSLRRDAEEATLRARSEQERARAQEERAQETQAFLDTSVMMESMYDLENTLNVALIRLAELAPYDVCAVYLRDADQPHLRIERLTGMASDDMPIRTLPLDEFDQWGAEEGARHWPTLDDDASGLGTLAGLDPNARSVIVAPLQTLEDFFGLIYMSSHEPGALTNRHCQVVNQFAQYVVFPIQRVRLQTMAATDGMTGLDNYRSFRLRLADEVRRAYRYGHPLSLILLDIDYFKKINDTYLHVAGDAILKQMAALLRRSLRGIDIAARYGGEEMVIICPETALEAAVGIAERIRSTVEETRFGLPQGGDVQITISLGVATLGEHATGDAALVERADRALYAAKAAGRNAVRTASDASPGSNP